MLENTTLLQIFDQLVAKVASKVIEEIDKGEEYLTTKEVADKLKVSENTILRWVAEESMPHVPTKPYRFIKSAVDEWMWKRQINPPKECKKNSQRSFRIPYG